jgi:DNA-binding NarL/FixJ family response regulator
MNLTLPTGKGIELINKVRAFVPDVPLVILTDLDNDEASENAIRASADDYLVRTRMSLRSLCERIGNAIVRKQAIKEIRSIAPICSHVEQLESVIKESEARPDAPPYPRRAVETFTGRRNSSVGEDSDRVVDTELETKISK